MYICPLLCSDCGVREQCSNIWVPNSRKQYLFWIPASVETFKTARHSCAVKCMSSSSAPGVSAVPSTRNSLLRWSIPPWSRDLELLKELFLTGGTCYWDAVSASVHFSGCSERSSGSLPHLKLIMHKPPWAHTHIRLVPTLGPAPQSPCKLSLATLSCTGWRWKGQLSFRRTS